ncbi:MAG: hypothetical protein ABH864_07305 [archaeon]
MVTIEYPVTRKDIKLLGKRFGRGEGTLDRALDYVGSAKVSEGNVGGRDGLVEEAYLPVLYGLGERFPPVMSGPVLNEPRVIQRATEDLRGFHARNGFNGGEDRLVSSLTNYVDVAQTLAHDERGSTDWRDDVERIFRGRRRLFAVAAPAALAAANFLVYLPAELLHRFESGAQPSLLWHMTSGFYPELQDFYMASVLPWHVAASVATVGGLALAGARKVTRKSAKADYISEKRRELIEITTNDLLERYGSE